LKKFLANHALPQSTATAKDSAALRKAIPNSSADGADEEKEQSASSSESSKSKAFIQHKKGLYRPVFVV